MTELYIRVSETQKDIETENTLLAAVDERIRSHKDGIEAQKSKIEAYKAQLAAFEISQSENRVSLEKGEKLLAELNSKRFFKADAPQVVVKTVSIYYARWIC